VSRAPGLFAASVPHTALVIASACALLAFSVRADETPTASPPVECEEQEAQPFLVRGNFVRRGRVSRDEARARSETHARAIRYRTEQYGHFAPFGRPEWNAATPASFAKTVRFFGLRVRLHEKILPAVKCAEREIVSACGAFPYTPRALSGLRDRNTYRGGEVSNHVYGIALDIDPLRNTCCGCVPPWNEALASQRPAASVYERMDMPECWVHAFEKYGFYWLGHDALMDTMHFEFLGDPARIVRASP
jgi:hypothetical protein